MIYYAVKNITSGTTVGLYSKDKAESLAKEWNGLFKTIHNDKNNYEVIKLKVIE